MGIDIYLRWKGMLPEERDGQITGFDVTKGDVGYLREAYHGGPYATQFFVKEAFDARGEAKINAETLKERLPRTIDLVKRREMEVYGRKEVGDDSPVVQSFVNFAELAEMKEKASGEPCTIIASY